MKKTLCIFIFAVLCVIGRGQVAFTPTVIASTGQYYGTTGGPLEVSYTIGEMVITSAFSGGDTLTQGFHQPRELIPMGLWDINRDDYGSVVVYPVPAVNNLWYGVQFPEPGNLEIKITDARGREVQELPVIGYKSGKLVESLNTSFLASATYLMQVNLITNDNKTHLTVKQFIITK